MTATTHERLRDLTAHMDESMGHRNANGSRSLLPQFSPVPQEQDIGRRPKQEFGTVELHRVIPDPSQPRTEFKADAIQRLADSIREKGQLHPIRVRWDEAVGKWIIISGERRYRAAQAAGLESIDCYFHEGELCHSEILEQQLIENLLREDLKPLEEARAYSSLMELNGWNGKQVAAALQVSTSRVSRALALLDLPPDIQQQVESGELARTSAYELAKLPSDDMRRAVTDETNGKRLTQRQAASAVRKRRGKPKPRDRSLKLTFTAENGIRTVVNSARKHNYHEVLEALKLAVEEVELRIDNNVQLL